MADIEVTGLGAVGVIADLTAPNIPNNAWTASRNIRFLDGSAWQFNGHGEIYAGPPVIPYHVMPVDVGAARYWLYAGSQKIYAVTGNGGTVVHTNLTRQTAGVDVNYSGSPNQWTSTSLSGIPILNPGNTSDPPQQWDLNTSNRLTGLSNWPANTYCKSLRAYKNQLVALNVTESGTNYPYMVRASTLAAPGAVPDSWDYTDTTKDAIRTDLAEGGDPIIDGMQLGSTFLIYKRDSTWRMDYTGGPFVDQFTKVGGVSGAMNQNCLVAIELGGVPHHVTLTNSDVIAHNGQSARSIIDKQARRTLFQSIDADHYTRSFVFKNPFVNEVFICYPEAGNTVPNLALVWNYGDGTVTFREIPNLNHANYGPVESGSSQPFDGDGSPIDSELRAFNAPNFTPDTSRALLGSNDQKLFLLDSSTTFDGAIPTAYLERQGLSFVPRRRMNLITGIRPDIKGNAGETVIVKIGGANTPYDTPTYSATMTYTIGSTVQCDCMVAEPYIAVRFESGTAYQWRLDAYTICVEDGGMF